MKYFYLIIFLFIHACGCQGLAQTYIEKQATGAFNFLQNPGYENGKAKWTFAFECSIGSIPWNGLSNASCSTVTSAKTLLEQERTFPEYRPFIGSTLKASIYAAANSNVVQVCGLFNSAETSCVSVDEAVSLNAAGYKEYAVAIKIPDDQSTSFTAGVRVKTTGVTSTSIRADQAFVGPWTGVVGLALNSVPMTSWSPSIAASSGTVTNFTISKSQWTRQGQFAWYFLEGSFTGSPGTWTSPRFSLPSGHVPVIGSNTFFSPAVTLGDTGTTFYDGRVEVTNNSGVYNLTMRSLSASSGSQLTITNTSPFTWASGDTISIAVGPVQITGWEANTVADVVGLVPSETVFSAQIDSSGVPAENSDFINGNCSYASNQWTCNYVSNKFSFVPTCTATTQTALHRIAGIVSASASSIVVQTFDDAGSRAQLAFNLICQMRGADYTNARKTFQNVNFNIDSGTYTPTLTNTTNIAASTVVGPFNYVRIGNFVIATGTVEIDPTTTGATVLRLSLPITTGNFSNNTQCSGNGTATIESGFFSSVSSTQLCSYTLSVTATTNITHGLSFMYQIQ